MNDDIFKAALAGLLHDVGKFAQRAGELGSRTWDGEAEQDYKYQHALYSGDFVEKYVPSQWATGLSGPARHHRPQTHHDRVTALADRLSAGERADSEDKQPRQLQSIFCSLTGLTDADGRPIETPDKKYLPLKKLAIEDDTIFPVDTIDDSYGTYEALWRGFEADAQRLKAAYEGDNADLPTYLHSLLNLMQQYTWCIPSAYYQSVPDVSLYDHSRMTAALAACLAKRPEDKIQAWLAKESQDEPVALLVGGDISGVQAFIYTITSRGATSGLRGRSMYLQLLTEVAARYVLDELNLPLTNLIYAGGGHFYLLAPAGCENALERIRGDISRILLQHHRGDLYLALAHIPLHADEFSGTALSQRWEDLSRDRLQTAKQRQFSELDMDSLKALFTPQEHGGNEEKFCAVCQREHPDTKVWHDEEAAKCPACHSFEQLGEELRRASHLCLEQWQPTPLSSSSPEPGEYWQVLAHFGYQAKFHRELARLPEAAEAVTRRTVLALSDAGTEALQPGPRQAIGRHFLVNVTPTLTPAEVEQFQEKVEDQLWPNSVKPFEIMARQAAGIKRLGVLRLDVDNLGKIFSKGLDVKATLSRVASLSFAMRLFFEGWVAQVADRLNSASEHDLVYSIYSGGDDLFFVGAWHLMPDLAEDIRDDLARYTGQHPSIHVSGGVALIPQKYPLYQAAEDAHRAEQAAKANVYEGYKKNALNFFGKTIPWTEFEIVKEYRERLTTLVTPVKSGGQGVSHSLVQRLSRLYVEYEEARQIRQEQGKEARVYWGRGQWQAAYSLSRLAGQHQQAKAEITALRNELKLEDFTNIEWIGPAARWTELTLRKGA